MNARMRVALLAWGVIILGARVGVEVPVHPFEGLTVFVASQVRLILAWIGLPVSQYAASLYIPGGFGYVVVTGCTGVVPAAVLAIAILASPASAAARALGLVVAVPLVLLLNLLRLVHLFYLGVYDPQKFGLAHEVLWECALIVATVGIWFGWWSWAGQRRDRATPFNAVMSG
ncbi:MAG TPA: archaeosortase/exosortase family protein [Gemmatimonadales bacterium]|nr:archaeosortase/exosortase family protein [Gemmatimonadales bacterium]